MKSKEGGRLINTFCMQLTSGANLISSCSEASTPSVICSTVMSEVYGVYLYNNELMSAKSKHSKTDQPVCQNIRKYNCQTSLSPRLSPL